MRRAIFCLNVLDGQAVTGQGVVPGGLTLHVQVLVGQGVEPRAWHPLAHGIGEGDLAKYMAGISLMIEREVAAMQSYDDFLAATRPAAGVAA